jgi:hypothetical protein
VDTAARWVIPLAGAAEENTLGIPLSKVKK